MEVIIPTANKYRLGRCGQGAGRCGGGGVKGAVDEDSQLRPIVPCGDMRPLMEGQRRGARDGCVLTILAEDQSDRTGPG